MLKRYCAICNQGIKKGEPQAKVTTLIDTKFGERVYVDYHHLSCRKEIENKTK